MEQHPEPTSPTVIDLRTSKKRRRSDVAPWHRIVINAASKVRGKYGPIDPITAKRIMRDFKAALVPRRAPGRKVSKEVATAAEMRSAGTPWLQIYPAAFEGFDRMPFEVRSYRKYNLRRAVAAYLRRRRSRDGERSPNETVRPTV